MKRFRFPALFSIGLPLLLLLPLLTRFQLPVSSATYSDPFRYCAAVGTVDEPDARYTGPAVPPTVAEGLRQAMELPESAPLEPLLLGTFWRCMEGQVYACTVGANIPCMEKADVSRTPTEPMIEFCRANPGAEYIPAVVTGRATVYEWRCEGSEPVVERQLTEPDARGFLSAYWYQISPPETSSETE